MNELVSKVVSKLNYDSVIGYGGRILLNDLKLIAEGKLQRYVDLGKVSAKRLNMLSGNRVNWLMSSKVEKAVKAIQGIIDHNSIKTIRSTAIHYEKKFL